MDLLSLNVAIQQLAETSESTCSKQVKLNRHIQKQLDHLKTSIKTEQSLSEQILDLREIKATMKERLQASETSLAEARQIIIGLEGKEQYLNTDVSALKTEILLLRGQPTEDPTTIDHVRKIESRNSDLENTLARKHEELSDRNDQVQCMAEDATERQKLIDGLTSQIDEAKVTIQVLEKQKAGCEKQADIKYEGLKSQLLEASNAERAILTKENLIKVEKLQQQKFAADNKVRKAEEEVGRLKAGKEIEVRKLGASSYPYYQQANLAQSKRLGELQEELRSLNRQIQSRNKELREVEEKFRTTEENLLAQIQKHKEEELRLDQRIAETDTCLAARISEFQSRNEENLRRINEVCRAHNSEADAQVDIDHGIDILHRMLTQAKECPRILVRGESTSQEVTQQPVSPNELRERNVTVCEEGPQDLMHNDSTLDLQRRRGGPSDTHASHQSRDEIVVQESQIQKTTIRRNLTTMRSREYLEGINRASLRTPIKRPENRLESPLLASMNRTRDQLALSSPPWNSAELLPPTPIPSLKEPIHRNQTASKNERRATYSVDKVTAALEVQSTGASYDAKVQRPSIPPRRVKRSAADFGMTPRIAPSKRRTSGLEAVGLGPILPDSQSPSKIQTNNKGRESRRQAPLDKYAVRFHGVR
ncbi:nuclear mitotic apparatus protein 1 [Xylographa soralifera]|nr:nuclear mitotic apparatus protein 1 [Xylographa soralifera]